LLHGIHSHYRDKHFYKDAGVKEFQQSRSTFERLYSPYPAYDSSEYLTNYYGRFVTCNGPRGTALNTSIEDSLRVYDSVPNRFPQPFIGSNEAIGLHTGICSDRTQRFAPYGLDSENKGKFPTSEVEWDQIHWGKLQDECVSRNKNRFEPKKRRTGVLMPDARQTNKFFQEQDALKAPEKPSTDAKKYASRTAVLLRTWEGYEYSQNDLMTIRAMITELALHTGGEYEVFLLVNVKDRSQPIFSDAKAYRALLEKVVPKELQEIAILWSEEICERLYPDVGDWQVYWQQFMPVQWFSQTHPHFDFVWNWEMDVRYTGNHYHFMSQIAYFAEMQPRKYLWERNARFYIPNLHGNSYENFLNDTHETVKHAAKAGILKPVWGPKTYSPTQTPLGPKPPTSMEEDDFEWGVGEEADLITLLPIWDPVKTKWTMKNKVWNYVPGVRPQFSDDHPTDDGFSHPDLEKIPRRGYINTGIRMSRRLISAMHSEQMAGRSMQAEMWPTTAALQHGFKAVYAPQPIWTDRKWPARYADAVFNADGGVPGRWGQEEDSIYNQDREVNFKSWSWYYHATFPKVLYRRWMGWKAEDDGLGKVGGEEWEDGRDGPRGKMCLPPMLLHPVKRGDLESKN
jgi:Protein of unknown function (DUF3405)